MRKAMTFLEDAPGSVVIHCTAGQDRTGVVAALLLLLNTMRRMCRGNPQLEALAAREAAPERQALRKNA